MPSKLIAEIIAIGDELTSGFRLDTNSQWLAQQLGDLGIEVLFHTTVGDDMDANVNVFRHALTRADVVITTGGLGPTADDLTRQALAKAAEVPLRMDHKQLELLKDFFQRRGRPMTPSNEIQAHFPEGSIVIPNPEGTAPGIEMDCTAGDRETTVFCLPGVPAEMKQMYAQTVVSKLQSMTGQTQMIHHHVVRCFGAGESRIESLLPDIVKRGRDPQVGITASGGIISLRLTTKGDSVTDCLTQMAPTLETINQCLGHLVLGYNDDTLASVVAASYRQLGLSIAVADAGLNGSPALLLKRAGAPVQGAEVIDFSSQQTEARAESILQKHDSKIGVAVGPIDRNDQAVNRGQSRFLVAVARKDHDTVTHEFLYSGHSAIRETLAEKRVLNVLRLLTM
jgi:nicotinamide-nucleotide amidase